jgi:murein DD-endopeptidase MepM/ murein hydrolase activator NlpD
VIYRPDAPPAAHRRHRPQLRSAFSPAHRTRDVLIAAIAFALAPFTVVMLLLPASNPAAAAPTAGGQVTASTGPDLSAPASNGLVVDGSPSPSASAAPGSPDPSASPQPPTGLTGYEWPLVGPQITLPYGPTPWGEYVVDGVKFHDGIDLATSCGDEVHAAHDGTVLAAGIDYDKYMGWIESLDPYYHLLDQKSWWHSLPLVVILDDGDGFRSIYAHESKLVVKPGETVKAGDLLGYEGATGNASGCHVHFGLFRTSETATFALDPAIVQKDLMPAHEIARVNPLLVLPFRCEIADMWALFPEKAKDCPVVPTTRP